MARATTVRFTDEVFARLDQASARTGMPVNSIVVAACLEWMERHTPESTPLHEKFAVPVPAAPRWATLRRAVVQAVGGGSRTLYPFARFTTSAQNLLTAAQAEAQKSGFNYIGTEHILLAAFADPASHSARILASLGVAEEAVRAELERLLDGKSSRRNPRMVPTSRVKKVIELAFGLCGEAGDPRVSTGHILLALAQEGDGIAAHTLDGLGATPARIKTEIDSLKDPES